MPVVIGLVLIFAVAVFIGLLVSHRSHDTDDYYERDHEGPPVIRSTYPSGLE
jgi:hypothetical protein